MTASTASGSDSVQLKVQMLESSQGWTEGTGVILSEPTMEKLGLFSGDFLEISGRRKTVASCHPERFLMDFIGPPATSGSDEDIIRMNALTRGNAEVGIGETVTIRKTKARVATKVTLLPLYKNSHVIEPKDMQRSSNSISFVLGDNLLARGQGGSQFVQVMNATAGRTISNANQRDESAGDGGNQASATDQSNGIEMFVAHPLKTEFEILDPGWWSAAGISKTMTPILPKRGFPAFWVHVGLSGRIDPMHARYLSLILMISHSDGMVRSSFEVAASDKKKQKEERFDMAKMLQGLQEASRTGIKPESQSPANQMMRMIHRSIGMGMLGDIYENAGPYVEEAVKLVDDVNREQRNSNTALSPAELMFRILRRWTEMEI